MKALHVTSLAYVPGTMISMEAANYHLAHLLGLPAEKRTSRESEQTVKELVFDLVRVGQYGHLPSRLRCLFAWEDDAAARTGVRLHGLTGTNVYELELLQAAGDTLHRADSCWLNCNAASAHEICHNAHRYWRAEMSANPVVEILYWGPARVVRKIR